MIRNQPLIQKHSFEDVLPAITQIRQAFGAPSISCGVLHKNEVIFPHGEGLADIEKNLAPDEHTVYPIASCSKSFTAAACGILVNEGKLSWTEPVQTYLPEFQTKADPEIGKRATLLDLCSHGTGIAPMDHLVTWFYDEYFIDNKDMVQIAANQPTVYDFRSKFLYNNTMLGIVSDVIAKVSGKSAGTVLQEKIFEPLGMTRSCTKTEDHPKDGNVARGYAIMDDNKLLPLPYSDCRDGGPQGGAGYARSSVHDMLLWARAVMEAEDVACTGVSQQGKNNPLKDIPLMRTAHRPITTQTSGTAYENSDGMGWFRHMLPSSWLGSIGPNFSMFSKPPIINQAGPPRLTISHYGEFNGYLTAFYTFPDTKSAIIVMANCSPGRGDPTDLIAQTLIQKLFNMKPHVNLVDYTLEVAQTISVRWPSLIKEFDSKRKKNTRLPQNHTPAHSQTQLTN